MDNSSLGAGVNMGIAVMDMLTMLISSRGRRYHLTAKYLQSGAAVLQAGSSSRHPDFLRFRCVGVSRIVFILDFSLTAKVSIEGRSLEIKPVVTSSPFSVPNPNQTTSA